MKKIKIFCWWTDSHNITDRFKKQFIGNKFLNNNIELVTDDSYEYAIIFGNSREPILSTKEKTIVFFQEPYWSSNWDRESYKKSSNVFCSSKKLYGEYEEFKESLLYMLYGGHGDLNENPILDWSVNSLIDYTPPKSKLLSIIQRKQLFNIGENIIYQDRINLADSLNSSDIDIDIYGGLWVNDNKKVKGEIWNKKIGLNDYMFSVAIENTIQPNYISEKFFDCILTNTVPIYFGCSNIKDIIPEDCYIHLPDIKNIEECLHVIRTQCNIEKYNSIINNVNKLKQQYFSSSKYNLWHKIQEFVK